MRKFLPLAFAAFILGSVQAQAQESSGLVDGSAHLHAMMGMGRTDYDGAAREAVRAMDEFGFRLSVLQPPPFTSSHAGIYDDETLAPIANSRPERLRFMAGGGSLSPMLLDAAKSGEVGEETKKRFAAAANRIAGAGAVGFGEIALEHFGLGPEHGYEYAPADHPLMLMLADIAAEKNIPVFVHLEAIEQEAPIEPRLAALGNPAVMKPNIPAFERLLSHNPKARFVWGQLGWDNSGQRTPELMARLFQTHPNLYAAIKIGPDSLPQNRPLARGQGIPAEWRQLFERFPDRVLLGGDQFHVAPGARGRFHPRLLALRDFAQALPKDLAAKIGYENAVKVYRLER